MRVKCIVFSMLFLFSTSCFYITGKGGDAKVLLSIWSRVPANVAKIHVAVCEGAISSDTVLNVQTFEPGSMITVTAPAGAARIMYVVTEDYQGYINYSGASTPVDLESNSETALVAVQLVSFGNVDVLNNPTYTTLNITWSANWYEEYEIQRNIGASSAPTDAQYTNLVTTKAKSYSDYLVDISFSNYWYRVRCYSVIFGKYTQWRLDTVGTPAPYSRV